MPERSLQWEEHPLFRFLPGPIYWENKDSMPAICQWETPLDVLNWQRVSGLSYSEPHTYQLITAWQLRAVKAKISLSAGAETSDCQSKYAYSACFI